MCTLLTIGVLTNTIQAATALSLAAMEEAHDEVTENIRLHADLINMPRFGSPDNYAYGAAQLNIAPAQAANSGMTHNPFGQPQNI